MTQALTRALTRALRAVRANWPFALVCLGVLVGLAVVVLLDRFRRGTLVMAGAVLFGAWLRVLLPEEQLGLLRVRGRAFDVVTLLALGLGLSVVALVVPPPS
ncbi:MAG: DUF3017 domain-containing protein [Actinomycetes bacterium]